MTKLKLSFLSFLMIISFSSQSLAQENEQLLDILRSELRAQYDELKKKEVPPYMMSYRVIDKKQWALSSTFGALSMKFYDHSRVLMPQIRLGDKELDNFIVNFMGNQGNSFASLPIDDVFTSKNSVCQPIWQETQNRYDFALYSYKNTKTDKSIKVDGSDKAPAYSDAPIEKYYEPIIVGEQASLNSDEWIKRINEVSSLFKYDTNITENQVGLSYLIERRYFLDTEGREVVQNLPYARLLVSATVKADDGMELPLFLSYFAYNPKDLPSQDSVMYDAKMMHAKLMELRNAPLVDPYTGPALLAGEASGVFFHEIFGHRIEGRRMKNDSDGQTFKKMVGEYVLPKAMSVSDDPTRMKYGNQDLNGYYKFDDEGTKAECVNVVKNGVLSEFLMTRTPIDGFPRSNGHARGESGLDPVSRQSNLIIETSEYKTDAELRKLLLGEVKKQNKEFGFYFKEVTGGLTYTGSGGGTNSFSVTPLEVYKVYLDGRPDELVRGVDMIGTPLSMFSNIIHAGGKDEVFTGTCGAESGGIPVTAISPTILVSKVEVQLKNKSQEKLRTLKSPVKK